MSNELVNQVETLTSENEILKKQVANNSAGVNALLAQIDAIKLMYNESNNSCLNHRTNVILLQKQQKELVEELEAAKKKIVELSVPAPAPGPVSDEMPDAA